MKKVLIALDYNPVAEQIAEVGYDLAKKLNCEVCLIHVVADLSYYEISYSEFMGYVPVLPNFEAFQKKEALRKIGNEMMKHAAEHLKDSNVKTHVAQGNTADAILDYANEWNADLIVMGTHSHSTLEKIFLGSVAANLIERTKVPVYLVPVKRKK
ncbi:MAG TPA: universal stress protein [Flavobacteriaceae bacterium]|nr:universal stress protein [Flavobacteriaceae bacterium]